MESTGVQTDLGYGMYYSRSNLAYDFTLFEEDPRPRTTAKGKGSQADPAENDGSTTESASRGASRDSASGAGVKRIRRRKSNFARIALGVVFGIAVVFIVVSIIHGQVQLTELNQEIADAKAMLAEQQSIYTQLEMKVDSSISTSVVEEYAKDKLNMSKAANSQKEFVNLSEGDKAEVSMSSDKSIFEAIADAFASLWS